MATTLRKLCEDRPLLRTKWLGQLQRAADDGERLRELWATRFTTNETSYTTRSFDRKLEFVCDVCHECKDAAQDTRSRHSDRGVTMRMELYRETFFSVCGACISTRGGNAVCHDVERAAECKMVTSGEVPVVADAHIDAARSVLKCWLLDALCYGTMFMVGYWFGGRQLASAQAGGPIAASSAPNHSSVKL